MEYTYKIIASNIEHNVMEVEFSAPDHETYIVGMPLPVEGQDYLDIIKSYAPVQQWVRSKQLVVDVPVGEVGTLSSIVAPSAIPGNIVPPELTIEQITQMLTPPPAP
jgi:hypothetical protein